MLDVADVDKVEKRCRKMIFFLVMLGCRVNDSFVFAIIMCTSLIYIELYK